MYIQIWVYLPVATAGPSVRAGFIDAPVDGLLTRLSNKVRIYLPQGSGTQELCLSISFSEPLHIYIRIGHTLLQEHSS